MKRALGCVLCLALVASVAACEPGMGEPGDECGADAACEPKTVYREPEPTDSTEPVPEAIDDGVVSIRPKSVRPGEEMTLAISDPPASYGLAWFLYRRDGSEWVYVGGFRAGPPGQWKDHAFNRFYFLPKWRNVGIESIAFDGNDSIVLEVPRLEPGTYRIAGAFDKKGSGEKKGSRQWHLDVFEVIE